MYKDEIKKVILMKDSLKHIIGLMAFFIAIGMLLMFFISSKVGAIILILILLVIGYICLISDL